jgi:hypothetical protein
MICISIVFVKLIMTAEVQPRTLKESPRGENSNVI